MRLLNTSTLKLHDFVGPNTPSYVILSHTWEEEEVLFHDIQNNAARSKKGYFKLVGCCRKALEDGFEWVWIDTCCIDKTSSAELSEAINSMYQWYANATICYAFLQDVAAKAATVEETKDQLHRLTAVYARLTAAAPENYDIWVRNEMGRLSISPGSKNVEVSEFAKSRWFTRGWTLQELLAPKVVEFYTSEWIEIGTKESLARRISAATGIPVRILRGEALSACSVAERMSWASARQTTREEDRAYCLLGLFDVNMPLLYGEGTKSFVRLQEQILKQEEDYSIFAWTLQHDCGQSLTGFLASSPSEFCNIVPQNLQLPTLVRPLPLLETATDYYHSEWEYLDPYTFTSQFRKSGESFYKGESYHVLYQKGYDRLRKHDFHRQSEKAIDWEPPELTSRGLRVSLPVRQPKNPELPAVAWINCEIDEGLVCILLQPASTRSSGLLGRHSSPWLISVDKALKADFVIEGLYLHPSGLIEDLDSNPSSIRPSLQSPWGRVRVVVPETKNYAAYVVHTYPTRGWSLDEFFFRDDPKVIGIIVFECARGQQVSRFEVYCGIVDGHAWCSISEDLDERTGEETEQLGGFFERRVAQVSSYFARFTDRTAKQALKMPGTVLATAIRKSPTAKGHPTAYTLRVEVYDSNKCDEWFACHDKPVSPKDNFEKAATEIRSAAVKGAQLAVLPEFHLTSWVPEHPNFAASCGDSVVYKGRYQELARELNIHIIPGTIIEPVETTTASGGRVVELHNLAHFIAATTGDILFTYQKKNLWHIERGVLTAGRKQPHKAFDVPLPGGGSVRVGMLVCWDLSFPEASRELAMDGAQLIVISAFWDMFGMDPRLLALNRQADVVYLDGVLLARAYENNSAIAFCNAWGQSQVTMPTLGSLGKLDPHIDDLILSEVDFDVLRLAEEHYKIRVDIGGEDWHYACRTIGPSK
ncbi:Vegetative incompatibility protein HET-E-1 [Cladobotryum mycophilum]|uniref:Vegetative incompatibility protein HET-E-1 n=1 Tax=Cladobotryum mycophilum TaxID=491253 RepID=A0ABR0SQY2_9HYPO